MPRIKDLIASQSLGIAGRAVKSIANTVRGVINNRTDSGVATSPFKTEQLTYPADLGTEGSEQGHYIIFTVREFTKSGEVEASEKSDAAPPVNLGGFKYNTKVDPNAILSNLGLPSKKNLIANNKIEGLSADKFDQVSQLFSSASNSVGNQSIPGIDDLRGRTLEQDAPNRLTVRAPTQRSSTFITLYMPPQIKNITGANYKDQEISASVAAASTAITDELTKNQIDSLEGVITRNLTKGLADKFLGAVGVDGVRELLTLNEGILVSNRMELVFDSVTKRQFTYTFNFYPKSEKEAIEVDKIIRVFRANMLPTRVGDITLVNTLGVPNEFNIDYMYKGQQNSFMNRIGNCVLSDMDVTYGGDKFAGFRLTQNEFGNGSPPTETTVTLTFRELDILTRELVEDGF
jgi:hypothetical protein